MYRIARLLAAVGLLIFVLPSQLVAQTTPPPPATQQPTATEPPPKDTELTQLKNRVEKLSAVTSKEPTTEIICGTTDFKCTPSEIFISAASIARITIDTGAYANKKLTVRVTAGETDPNLGDVCVARTFDRAPDRFQVSVNKERRTFKTYEQEPDKLLGYRKDPRDTGRWEWSLKDKNNKVVKCGSEETSDPNINFLTFGRSKALLIELEDEEGHKKTFDVTIVYQRWFVATGGILIFSKLSDQELVKKTDSAGKTTVTGTRKRDTLIPETGAVLDFYPANYPQWALFQFGLVGNGDRQPSYFVGTGYRLRAIGSKALATISAGVIARQTLRFPDIGSFPVDSKPDDAAQKGISNYRFGGYIALSFGFKFGDVDGTK